MAGDPTILLTRPRAQAEAFAKGLPGRVVISPVIGIEHREPPSLGHVAGVIFTSANGVCAAPPGQGLRAWCVGPQTAAAANAAGYKAEAIGPDANALVDHLIAKPPGGPLIHLRGAHARGGVAGRLTAAGQPCDDAIVYDQRALPLSEKANALLAGNAPVLLPLFSPRSARLMSEETRGAKAPVAIAALSPNVLSAWTGPDPLVARVAEQPDGNAMRAALDALIDAVGRLEAGRGAS